MPGTHDRSQARVNSFTASAPPRFFPSPELTC
jgi:hypothetical protein